MKYPRTIACSLLFVYIMLFLNACARNAVEVIGINDTGTTTAQIRQVKTFNQCESASVFKAEIQFSNTDSQQNERELVLTVGATGETGVSFFVRAELEGQIETHLKSSQTKTIGHEERASIEVPAYTQQEYTITWREVRRQGVIRYNSSFR